MIWSVWQLATDINPQTATGRPIGTLALHAQWRRERWIVIMFFRKNQNQ